MTQPIQSIAEGFGKLTPSLPSENSKDCLRRGVWVTRFQGDEESRLTEGEGGFKADCGWKGLPTAARGSKGTATRAPPAEHPYPAARGHYACATPPARLWAVVGPVDARPRAHSRVTRKGAAEEAGPGRRDRPLGPSEGRAGRWEVRRESCAAPVPAPSLPRVPYPFSVGLTTGPRFCSLRLARSCQPRTAPPHPHPAPPNPFPPLPWPPPPPLLVCRLGRDLATCAYLLSHPCVHTSAHLSLLFQAHESSPAPPLSGPSDYFSPPPCSSVVHRITGSFPVLPPMLTGPLLPSRSTSYVSPLLHAFLLLLSSLRDPNRTPTLITVSSSGFPFHFHPHHSLLPLHCFISPRSFPDR